MPLNPISAYKSISAGSFKTNSAQSFGNAAASLNPTSGPSFMDTLGNAAMSGISSLKQGEGISLSGLGGKSQVTEVVTALTDAEVTLQAATAIREKMIGAYQELMRMPV